MIMLGTRSRAAYRKLGAVLIWTLSLLTRAEILPTRAEDRTVRDHVGYENPCRISYIKHGADLDAVPSHMPWGPHCK